jgi:drug/metabolite transporter (DMT)-like permease
MTGQRADVLALPSRRQAATLAVVVASVSFSGPLMAATMAPALAIAFWRNTIGAAVSALGLLRRPGALRALTAPAQRRPLAIAGAAGVLLGLHFGLWVPSLTMTTVASATALVCTQVVFAALIARAQGAVLPSAVWWGGGLAIAGVALITGVDVTLSARAAIGDLLALGGGAAAAGYLAIGARARQTLATSTYTTVCYATAATVLLVSCLIGSQPLAGYSTGAWWRIVAVTVTAQLLGHSLMNALVATTSPTVLALVLLLEVPGAALIALVGLGQHPPITAIPGLILLLAGLLGVTKSRGRAAVEVTELAQ